MERIDKLKAFVEKEKIAIKSFKDPKNVEKHKWYIKESLTNMKGEMLREIDDLLKDKRTTLMRQYNNHNDSLRREIIELENERRDIYNFKFNDGAIMKNAKVRSFLAQEFKDLKARLSKKKFNDQKSKWIAGLATIKDALKNFKDADWSEGKHKRDKDGKFSSTGNGGKSAEESNAGSKKLDVKSLAKSKNKREVKKAAKAYWNYFLNGVDDLVDWAGEDEDLRYYAEDGDIDSMAEIMANSKGGRETAIEALDEMEEDELNGVSEHINDSAIKDEIVKRINWRGYHIWIQKWNNKYSFSVYSGAGGRGNPFAHDDGFESADEAYNAAVESAREHISYYGDSAEYINDRKIDIKKDGELIDTVNAESLDEAVRIYERQHPELRGQIDAYFSDEKVEDNEKDPVKLYRWLKENNIPKAVWLHHFIMSGIDKMTAKALISRYESGKIDTSIKDSLSEKAKRLIETAVREARYDYRVAIGFAEDDLKAEKEWSWSNQNEVKEYIRRLINNQLDR